MKNKIKTNVKYWYYWILKYFFFYKISFCTKKNICALVSSSMLSNVRIVRIALWMLETLEPSRQETIEARKYNNKCALECNRILCCLQVQPVAELSELSRRGGSDGRQVELAAANIRGGTLRRSGSLRFHQNMVSIFVSYFNSMIGSFFKEIWKICYYRKYIGNYLECDTLVVSVFLKYVEICWYVKIIILINFLLLYLHIILFYFSKCK